MRVGDSFNGLGGWKYTNIDSCDSYEFNSSYDGPTLFPVVIKDAEGKVKKIISRKKLQNRHWKKFNKLEKHYNNIFFREKELFDAVS